MAILVISLKHNTVLAKALKILLGNHVTSLCALFVRWKIKNYSEVILVSIFQFFIKSAKSPKSFSKYTCIFSTRIEIFPGLNSTLSMIKALFVVTCQKEMKFQPYSYFILVVTTRLKFQLELFYHVTQIHQIASKSWRVRAEVKQMHKKA